MAIDLTGKVIIITGASAGIGAATAIEAGRSGMRVVLAARRKDKLDQVAARVREAGGEALVVETDVADREDADRLVRQTLEHFGQLDVLFANAGFGYFGPLIEMDRATEDRMWQVNYFGALHCVRAAAAVMKQQQRGHILITGSILSHVGLPYYATYCATKAAQRAAIQALQLELEPDHIFVTGVYPSGTKTEFFDRVADVSGRRDGIAGNTPEGFMQSARTVAKKVIRTLRRPRPELWTSFAGRLLTQLWLACPPFMRLCFRMQARKYRKRIGD